MLQNYNPWLPQKYDRYGRPIPPTPVAQGAGPWVDPDANGLLSGQLPDQDAQGSPPQQAAQGGISGFLGSPQLLAIAAGLLSASGPSYKPIGLGEALGSGLNNMFKVNGQLSEQQAKQMQMQMQREEMKNRIDMMKAEFGMKREEMGMRRDDRREEMGMKSNEFGMEFGLKKAAMDLELQKAQRAMDNQAQLDNYINGGSTGTGATSGGGALSDPMLNNIYSSIHANTPSLPSGNTSVGGYVTSGYSTPSARSVMDSPLVSDSYQSPSFAVTDTTSMPPSAVSEAPENDQADAPPPMSAVAPSISPPVAPTSANSPQAPSMANIPPHIKQLARAYNAAGHPEKAIDLINNSMGGSYGDIKEGVGQDGKPAYFQVDKAGQVRAVPGYTPPLKEGSGYGDVKSGIGQDGKPIFFQIDKAGNVKTTSGITPPQKASDASPIQQEMAKIDAKSVGDSREALRQAISMRSSLDAFGEAQQQVPSWEQGRLAGRASPYFSATAQAAQTYGNQVSLLAKTLLGMPSNNFSDADRQFLIDASVGLTKKPEANRQVVSKLKVLLDQSVRYNQALEKQLNETGNLSGAAANFYNQEYNKPGAANSGNAVVVTKPLHQMSQTELEALKTRFNQ